MTGFDEADHVITLSDWAFAGNQPNLIRLRPSEGNDSLVDRIRESRTTEEDERILERVKNPQDPKLATIDEVEQLSNLLQYRYQDWPDSPKSRLTLAKRAVRDIATHTPMHVAEIWGMTVREAADILATIPMTTESGGVGREEAEGGQQSGDVECHVTLQQMAAIVNRSKRTLERMRDRGNLPAPAVKGGKGKPDEWPWSEVRSILEQEYSRQLPQEFPPGRFVRR